MQGKVGCKRTNHCWCDWSWIFCSPSLSELRPLSPCSVVSLPWLTLPLQNESKISDRHIQAVGETSASTAAFAFLPSPLSSDLSSLLVGKWRSQNQNLKLKYLKNFFPFVKHEENTYQRLLVSMFYPSCFNLPFCSISTGVSRGIF